MRDRIEYLPQRILTEQHAVLICWLLLSVRENAEEEEEEEEDCLLSSKARPAQICAC